MTPPPSEPHLVRRPRRRARRQPGADPGRLAQRHDDREPGGRPVPDVQRGGRRAARPAPPVGVRRRARRAEPARGPAGAAETRAATPSRPPAEPAAGRPARRHPPEPTRRRERAAAVARSRGSLAGRDRGHARRILVPCWRCWRSALVVPASTPRCARTPRSTPGRTPRPQPSAPPIAILSTTTGSCRPTVAGGAIPDPRVPEGVHSHLRQAEVRTGPRRRVQTKTSAMARPLGAGVVDAECDVAEGRSCSSTRRPASRRRPPMFS